VHVAECLEDDLQGLVEVVVGGAATAAGMRAQLGRREVGGVAGAGLRVRVGVVQGVAVLGDEGEQEPVDEP
jgi:NaMN:DMB phosphoribosyltransferase